MQISKLAFILSMALATVADGPPPTFVRPSSSSLSILLTH